MNTLVLMRHARAVHEDYATDARRRLAPDGVLQAGSAGRSIRQSGLVPELVLCSTASRTRQTWNLVRDGIGGQTEPNVTYDDDLYLGYIPEMVAALRAVPSPTGTVLVVGHNPTVSAAAAYLAGPGSDPGLLRLVRFGLSTGAYAVLDGPVDWAEIASASCRLRAVVKPGL